MVVSGGWPGGRCACRVSGVRYYRFMVDSECLAEGVGYGASWGACARRCRAGSSSGLSNPVDARDLDLRDEGRLPGLLALALGPTPTRTSMQLA